VNDPVAEALGAKPLDAEESVNFSLGAVMRFADLTITVDAYRIDIDDRIVLSENLTQANVRAYLESLGFVGVGGGRFFINGVDTRTRGLDVVVNWPWETAGGRFDFTLVANWNDTEVTRLPTTNVLSSLSPAPVLFGRINELGFEEGSPKDKFGASVNWSMDRWGATLRATRYGEVLDAGANASQDVRLSPAVLVDLEGRVDLLEGLVLAVGAENLTDEYSEPFTPVRNGTGNTPFSNFSPFGRSGRFVYGRLSYNFLASTGPSRTRLSRNDCPASPRAAQGFFSPGPPAAASSASSGCRASAGRRARPRACPDGRATRP
jgi:iron complex outermembrane receptor protein